MRGRQPDHSCKPNLYTENKCSNWRPYKPQNIEIFSSIARLKPVMLFAATNPPVKIYSAPPATDFLQPCTPQDIMGLLGALPASDVNGIEGIYLLGGSEKQLRSKRPFSWGAYDFISRLVFLHAIPADAMTLEFVGPPPHLLLQYRKAGAAITEQAGKIVVRFDEPSLRTFILKNVLLHEIAHHIGSRMPGHTGEDAERFCDSYVDRMSKQITLQDHNCESMK